MVTGPCDMKMQVCDRDKETWSHGCSSLTPLQDESLREKAQRLWAVLRDGVRSTVTKIKLADVCPSVLSHGLQLLRHLSFPSSLTHVTYSSKHRRLVSLDSAGLIRLHHVDGRVEGSMQATWPLCGLLYGGSFQQYVAWDPHELQVLDVSFTPISRCHVEQGVLCCVYEPGTGHVLSGGCGGVTVWHFRHSTQSLACHQQLCQGMTEQDKVTVIALDTASLLTQRCFAACRTSVWEYNLSDGRLRRIRRDLHLRRITGLLYSESLQLLISGSRDGAIKVWDGNGLLKGVYVGHTGPVTTLALCPPDKTFFSGSEDGTLRTWSLETQEQVGEQQVMGKVLGLGTFNEGKLVVSYTSCGLDVWEVQHLYQLHTLLGTAVTNIRVSREPLPTREPLWGTSETDMGTKRLPSRAVCVCADSAVRLLAVSTGDVISTLLLDSRVRSAEYCVQKESLYVLLEQGDLLRVNALENPMRILNRVEGGGAGTLPVCLTLYSSVGDTERAFTDWGQIVEQGGEKRPPRKQHPLGLLEEKNK
ncbi:WD repeat-containing protein 97-like [Ascaphus truei]|uniref:WD repeat-containing protein 97-like n=1 Tax=Ascaphus truei TaxID=8439 RepID=UPI003F599DFE